MLSRRSKLVLFLTAICLALAYLIYDRLLCRLEAFCVVTTVNVGPGRSIKILDESFSDFGHPFYYQVAVGDEIVVPTTFIWGCCRNRQNPGFTPLYTRDRNTVGLVWDERPEVLLLLHDFTTGENWPRYEDHDGWEKQAERGARP